MSLISDQQVEQFHESGYFVTAPMFEQTQLDEAASEFKRLWAEVIHEAERSGDPKYVELSHLRPFIGHAHTRSEALAEFIKAPIYLEACAKFIGPDADLYFNQAVIKPPEKGKHFGWH